MSVVAFPSGSAVPPIARHGPVARDVVMQLDPAELLLDRHSDPGEPATDVMPESPRVVHRLAVELDLETQDAEALARSALQLLRAAMADPDGGTPDVPADFPGMTSRRRHRNVRPGDNLDRR